MRVAHTQQPCHASTTHLAQRWLTSRCFARGQYSPRDEPPRLPWSGRPAFDRLEPAGPDSSSGLRWGEWGVGWGSQGQGVAAAVGHRQHSKFCAAPETT
jgi:hypothetical protein